MHVQKRKYDNKRKARNERQEMMCKFEKRRKVYIQNEREKNNKTNEEEKRKQQANLLIYQVTR